MRHFEHICLLLIIGFLWLTLLSCDEERMDITDTTPFFTLKFINADSLSSLNDSITTLNNSIKFADDSIAVLDSLVENGDSTDYTLEKDTLNSLKTSFNSRKSVLNKIVTTIISGAVQLDRIIAIGPEGGIINYNDTATSYMLSLNPNDSISEFNIFLADHVLDLKTMYSPETLVKERKVKIVAYNFSIIKNDSYDSLGQVQNDSTNFSSNDFTGIIYF